jgi:hypothetical protein
MSSLGPSRRRAIARHEDEAGNIQEEVMRRILGAVALIRTGWDADSFAVATVLPIANPAGCPIPDGYIALKPQKGYQTYYDAALLAFQINARVQVTVANTGCISGRPKLIGINLLR